MFDFANLRGGGGSTALGLAVFFLPLSFQGFPFVSGRRAPFPSRLTLQRDYSLLYFLIDRGLYRSFSISSQEILGEFKIRTSFPNLGARLRSFGEVSGVQALILSLEADKGLRGRQITPSF